MSDIQTSQRDSLGVVSTTVDLDWLGLGEHFMSASSDEQAVFLIGWASVADRMGYASEDLQYAWVCDAFPDFRERHSVAEKLYRLAAHLEN